MKRQPRILTFAQHEKLDDIGAYLDSDKAKVVGWHHGRRDKLDGPVIRYRDGSRQYISPTGRIVGLAISRPGPDGRWCA